MMLSAHDFFNQYICRSNIKRQMRRHTWTLDRRTMEAERRVVEDGLEYQRNPTPGTLCHHQMSSAALVTLQQCAHTNAWHRVTNSVNYQTNMVSYQYSCEDEALKSLSSQPSSVCSRTR
ncbi:hypothetical protein SK128_008396 [Halocaridina rubra]|uniref:Uncharacterized protein n=1 Tax=Halocaridina rubra TaxID=373956 RepID=A0AAN9A8J6_HALRR